MKPEVGRAEGRDGGREQLSNVCKSLLVELFPELTAGCGDRDQLIPPVGHLLQISILRDQPRQIALIGFNALQDEFGLLSGEDLLNRRVALLDLPFKEIGAASSSP